MNLYFKPNFQCFVIINKYFKLAVDDDDDDDDDDEFCFCGIFHQWKEFRFISSRTIFLTIANLRHVLSRIWTCAEPDFRFYWMKLWCSDDQYTTASYLFYKISVFIKILQNQQENTCSWISFLVVWVSLNLAKL